MPPIVRAAFARVGELFRHRSRTVAEQDDEFAFHIEMETAENVRRGMSEWDARRAAVLRFGGTQRFREETTDARGVVALDNLARDVRFALRRLRRAAGFSIGVATTLGIGISAAVGIGAIVYGVLVRDLPYANPDQLMRVGVSTVSVATSGDLLTPAEYFHFAKSARSFVALGAYWTSGDFTVTDLDAPERVTIASLTPNVLTLLSVRPLLGQLFQPADTSWTENPRIPILISENFWRRRYGADPAIVGRRIQINRGDRIVIGVLPRSFAFPTPSIDLYYPAPTPVNRPQIALGYLSVIGRLRSGLSPAAAEAELNALLPSLSERFPVITPAMLQGSRARVSVESMKKATVARVRPQLILLGILVALLLLTATTNVISLFSLRAERASQEVGIALSLGASRVAVAQRFIIEGIILGLVSAVIALPVAALALSTKFGFTERDIPRLHEIAFTGQSAALLLGCATAVGAFVGCVALTHGLRRGTFDRLRAAQSTPSRSWRRTQNSFVVFQVAAALVLLIAAGLLGRSLWNLSKASIGFVPRNAMTFQVSLPWNGYTSYGSQAAFHAKLTDRLAALPRVSSVGVTLRVPLASPGAPYLDAQLQSDDGQPIVTASGNLASADYFRAMGIRLLDGRGFHAGDLRGAPAVILSERLAKTLFGSANVVGRHLRGRVYAGSSLEDFRIVGVVGDVPWARIEDGPVPTVYFPLLRDADGLPVDSNPVRHPPIEVSYVLRGTQLPSGLLIQDIVKTLDPRVPAANVRPLRALVDDATARVRLTLLLIAVAGVASLLLGVIGVYSVVAYAANARRREFGIRLALGAVPGGIARMVFADGLALTAVGAVIGLFLALATTRFLRTLLYEVNATSVTEFGLATALLCLVALMATIVPARQAARTQPAVVLRGD
jgi:predicted permease